MNNKKRRPSRRGLRTLAVLFIASLLAAPATLQAQWSTTGNITSTNDTVQILTPGSFSVAPATNSELQVTTDGGAMPAGVTAGIGVELSRSDGQLGASGNGIHSASGASGGMGMVLNGRNWIKYTTYDGDVVFSVSEKGSFAFNADTDNSHMGRIYSGPNGHARGIGLGIYQERDGPTAIGAIIRADGNVNGSNIAAKFEAKNATDNYAILVPNNSGLVGFGTETPAQQLHVSRKENAGASGNVETAIRLAALNNNSANTFGGTWDLQARSSDGAFSLLNSHTTHGLDKSRMVLTADGLLGLGTDAPTRAVEVTRTKNAGITGNAKTELRLQALNQATIGIDLLGATWDFRANSVDGDLTFVNSHTTHGSNETRVRFTSDGKVGIGIDPTYALDVNGEVNATGYRLNGVPLQNGLWSLNGNNAYYTSGIVGINTSNPGTNYVNPTQLKLDVSGHARFGSTSDYVRVTGGSIDHYGPNKLHLNYFSHEDVAIGDPSATQKSNLTVSGDITNCGKLHTTEIEVRSSWCDYVFDDDYELMSIEELDTYLTDNKHLPNIPSAKVVEEEGLQMADMQRRMMEKIEELSLYVIQLNDRLKQAEDNALKAKQ